jgi:hypothetical protein
MKRLISFLLPIPRVVYWLGLLLLVDGIAGACLEISSPYAAVLAPTPRALAAGKDTGASAWILDLLQHPTFVTAACCFIGLVMMSRAHSRHRRTW